MNTAQYLAACKKKLNIESDYALAKALGVKRQTLQKWQKGDGIPTNLGAFKIAEVLGEQPAGVIADLELERAQRDGAEPEEVDQWKVWAQRLGGAAASILLAAGLGGFSNADAKLAHFSRADDSAHRMKRRPTWWGGTLGLV